MSGSGVSGGCGVSQWPMGISGQLDAEGSGWPQGSQCSPGVSQCLALGSHGASWGLTMVLGISGQLDAEDSMRLYVSQGSPGVSQCLGLGSQVAVGSYSGPRISWQLDAGVSGWPWRSQIGSRCLIVQPLASQGSTGVSECLGLGAQESPKVLGCSRCPTVDLGTQGSWTLRS